MEVRTHYSLLLLMLFVPVTTELFAEESEKTAPTAEDRLDDFFLNCDALTSDSCELVSGSVTTSDGSRVFPLDFVWFRAQKVEGKKKTRSYHEGRSYDLKRGPEGSFMERKLVVGDEGFYGMGVNPPLEPMDVISGGLPEDELEAYLVKQKRLKKSQYNFPEICPATVLGAVNLNPTEGTLGKAHALYRRMKLIDEYTKGSWTIATWRLDGKKSPGWACARIMFDKKQGHMPTYVEWRDRVDTKTDPNSPASYTTVFNVAEIKWTQLPTKEKKLWAPVRVVNKLTSKSSQEWLIEATWRHDVLQDQYFDVNQINEDPDGNPLAKLRRQMQNAADKAEKEKGEKTEKVEKPGK